MIEIIAEIGQNHNGDLNLAFELIREAKKAGADVAKIQVYDAVALFPKQDNPWYDYNLKTELNRDQISRIAEECDRVGIEFLTSVFDTKRIEWLEDLGVKRYKVASRSIHDQPLLNALIATHKPLLISLGHWDNQDFPDLKTTQPVDFLYCISNYPTKLADVHLSQVDFNRYSGFSDHTEGITASFAAMALGARIIEKHFTLDKTMYGPDHSCSASPVELGQLCHVRDELNECL